MRPMVTTDRAICIRDEGRSGTRRVRRRCAACALRCDRLPRRRRGHTNARSNTWLGHPPASGRSDPPRSPPLLPYPDSSPRLHGRHGPACRRRRPSPWSRRGARRTRRCGSRPQPKGSRTAPLRRRWTHGRGLLGFDCAARGDLLPHRCWRRPGRDRQERCSAAASSRKDPKLGRGQRPHRPWCRSAADEQERFDPPPPGCPKYGQEQLWVGSGQGGTAPDHRVATRTRREPYRSRRKGQDRPGRRIERLDPSTARQLLIGLAGGPATPREPGPGLRSDRVRSIGGDRPEWGQARRLGDPILRWRRRCVADAAGRCMTGERRGGPGSHRRRSAGAVSDPPGSGGPGPARSARSGAR